MLYAFLRVLSGTLFFLFLAATVGISPPDPVDRISAVGPALAPALLRPGSLHKASLACLPSGKRGPVAAEPNRAEPLLGLDLYRPEPDDNPLTAEKVALGRRLFRERLLSRNRALSCVGCHDPERAFTNGTPVAEGAYGCAGRRNVPALFNRAWIRGEGT
jgi:di-heme cytochrome c peroxidase